jgi:hypothetical protein
MHAEQLEARKRCQLFTPQQNPVGRLVDDWRRAASAEVSHPACLPASAILPACLSVFLSVCRTACLPAGRPAFVSACLYQSHVPSAGWLAACLSLSVFSSHCLTVSLRLTLSLSHTYSRLRVIVNHSVAVSQ